MSLHYCVKLFKDRRGPELSEVNCRARLGHLKQFLNNICSLMLASSGKWRKDI